MITVLLVEDHEIVRAGLRLLLDAQTDMSVIAEASTGDDALHQVRSRRPDVTVLDLNLPGPSGLAVVRRLQGDDSTRIVVLTRHDDDAYVREVLSAGSAAYVLKQSPSSELLEAIRAAARNERYLDTALRSMALDQGTARPKASTTRTSTISAREGNVLRLAAIGYSNKDIGVELNISVRTVEVHKGNAMRKLHLAGRAALVQFAVDRGWMKDP